MKKAFASIGLLTLCSWALAAPQQYIYSGRITDIRDYNSTNIHDYVAYGARFHGSLFYDPDAPFLYLLEPGRGIFQGPSEESQASVDSIAISGSSGEVQLFDDYGGLDMLFLPSVDNDISDLPESLQGFVGVIRVQLYGVIDGMRLPRTLDLDSFPGTFGLTGYSSTGAAPSYFAWHLGGAIDTLRAVPEPGTTHAVLAGLVVLVALRRSRQHKTTRGAPDPTPGPGA